MSNKILIIILILVIIITYLVFFYKKKSIDSFENSNSSDNCPEQLNILKNFITDCIDSLKQNNVLNYRDILKIINKYPDITPLHI